MKRKSYGIRLTAGLLFFGPWFAASVMPVGRPLPLVQEITVEADRFEKNAARISWRLIAPSSTGIFIGRSSVPIINEETLQNALNITGDGLPPETKTFLDRNLADGVYYYIVLTGEDLENRFGLPFAPGGNFTVKPFIVNTTRSEPEKKTEQPVQQRESESATQSVKEEKPDRAEPEKKAQTESAASHPGDSIYMVRNLTAVSTSNSVKLNWQPAPSIGIRYNIYRSTVPPNSPAVLRRARLIGTASENTLFFEDLKPAEDQEVFYAVTVTPLETGEEKAALQFGHSYISHYFKKESAADQTSQKEISLLPENLRAEPFGRNAIRLSWDIPAERVLDFRIYRSSQPVSSPERLQEALFIGSVSGRDTDFIDRDLEPGQYFYAVLPRDGRGKEIFLFQEGRSFTGFAGTVRPDLIRTQAAESTASPSASKPVYSMMFLKGEVKDGNVHLFWDGTPGNFPDTRLYIYRSSQPLRNQFELERNGVLIAIERPEKKEFTDRSPGEEIIYYAVQIYRNGTPDPKLVESVNFLKDPLILRREKADRKETPAYGQELPTAEKTENVGSGADVSRSDAGSAAKLRTLEERKMLLSSVLQNEYSRGKFGMAVKKLAPLTSESLNPDAQTRSTALFYTALSLFNMGDYRSAMDLFSHPDVQKAYPMRWNFWYRRSLEKLQPAGLHLRP